MAINSWRVEAGVWMRDIIGNITHNIKCHRHVKPCVTPQPLCLPANALTLTSRSTTALIALILFLLPAIGWSQEKLPDNTVFSIVAPVSNQTTTESSSQELARLGNGTTGLLLNINATALRDLALIENSRIELPLAQGHIQILQIDSVSATASGSLAVTGFLTSDPQSRALLILTTDGIAQATIMAGDATYALRYQRNGLHHLRRVDPNERWSELLPLERDTTQTDSQQDARQRAAAARNTDDGSVIDIMVLYTDAIRLQAGGDSAMRASAELAVLATNTGYLNSNVNHTVRLVHTEKVDYQASGSIAASLADLTFHNSAFDGSLDSIHALRNEKGADLTLLVTEDNDFCGRAWVMTDLDVAFADRAFAVVSSECLLDGRSFAHELGHTMGLAHNREADNSSGVFSDSFGYTDPLGQWRTIMAYNTCLNGPCIALNYYSNPLTFFEGTAMGVLAPSTIAADNARTLNVAASTVARFRASTIRTAPAIILPVPGESLSGSEQRFIWQGGDQQVDAWQLWLGTTPGTSNLYDSGVVTQTSAGAKNLPKNGQTIHATLRYRSNNVWRTIAATYHAYNNGKPALLTPTPGTTLASTAATFDWVSGGANINHWTLRIFDPLNAAQGDYFSQRLDGAVTQVAAAGWPTDGRSIIVELAYSTDGVTTITQPYTFKTPTLSITAPAISSPANDSTISASQAFLISAGGHDLANWRLVAKASSPYNSASITDSGWTTDTTVTLSGWPNDGSTVYLVFDCRYTNGAACRRTIYQFTTRQSGSTSEPAITVPKPDSQLTTKSTQVFWTANTTNVERWRIKAGSSAFTRNYFESDWQAATVGSTTVGGWPTDGSVVYLTLEYAIAGQSTLRSRVFSYQTPLIVPRLRINDTRVSEAAGVVAVTVERTAATTTASVRISTFDLTAQAGSDYKAIDQRLSFAVGERSKNISINIINDAKTEFNERFEVLLTDAIGAQIERAKAVVDISDDDPILTPGDDDVTINQFVQPVTFKARGDVLQLDVTVTNDGNRELTNVIINNPLTGGRLCTVARLWVDNTAQCSTNYTVTEADLMAGKIVFFTTINADQLVDTKTTTQTIELDRSVSPPKPGLKLVVRVEPEKFTQVGETLRYFLTVENTGDIELFNLQVTDKALGERVCRLQSLWRQTTAQCEAVYTVTADDINDGAIVTETKVTTEQISNATVVTTRIDKNASNVPPANVDANLVIQVSPSEYVKVGDALSLLFTIQNTGDTHLTEVVVKDSTNDDVMCQVGDLHAGVNTTCTLQYAVADADMQQGSIKIIASLNAAQLTRAISASALAALKADSDPEPQTGDFVMTAKTTPTQFSKLGETIQIDYTVNNTTNTPLLDLQVWQQQPGGGLRSVCAAQSLAPGIELQCTSMHTIDESDMTRGSVKWKGMVDTRRYTNGATTSVQLNRLGID